MSCVKEIAEYVEGYPLRVKKCVQELTNVCMEMLRAAGAMFEQEHLRFISMIIAAGWSGAGRGSFRYPKGTMEHKVVHNLRAVKGD